MRQHNLLPILLILFVILSLFILRNDFLYFANQIKANGLEATFENLIHGTQGDTATTPSTTTTTPLETAQIVENSITKFFGSVVTPGPLRTLLGNTDENSALTKQGIITATNAARKESGNLPPLIENTKLDTSSQTKVTDMFARQYFEHISPTGVGVANLASSVGYQYVIIGENLALGNFKTDQEVVDAWMASPGHRANILNVKYTDIGVAVMKGTFEGREVWMAVQHFGLPLSACPSIDATLKNDIAVKEQNIKNMETDLNTLKQQIDAKEGDIETEVASYNALVKNYNDLLTNIKIEVATYNSQVTRFNACLSG